MDRDNQSRNRGFNGMSVLLVAYVGLAHGRRAEQTSACRSPRGPETGLFPMEAGERPAHGRRHRFFRNPPPERHMFPVGGCDSGGWRESAEHLAAGSGVYQWRQEEPGVRSGTSHLERPCEQHMKRCERQRMKGEQGIRRPQWNGMRGDQSLSLFLPPYLLTCSPVHSSHCSTTSRLRREVVGATGHG